MLWSYLQNPHRRKDSEDERENRLSARHPCWVDVATSDLEAAERFYGELFGWEIPELPDSSAGLEHLLLPSRTPRRRSSGSRRVAATMTSAPIDVEVGRVAVVRDPWGDVFSVIKLNETA